MFEIVMTPELYMLRCLELAQKAKGNSSPNPMVGALLVHNDEIIGEGWHHYYGADHAEINCLRNVPISKRQLISESTMYVNLEPCAHFGITPPCSLRLVQEKIKRVVICNLDPFEKVSGKGIAILKEGNIEVSTGLLEKEGFWVNRRFFCYHKLSRPYIVLKWAKTIDGYIAPTDKSTFQITGDASMQLLHKWRTEESAIMVGTTTAINDNPLLTARLWLGKQPLRVVIDKTLKLPNNHKLFNYDAATWIINEKKDGLHGNVKYIRLAFDKKFLQNILHLLFEAKVLSVIIEGGATLLNSFIEEGLWDEARVFTGSMALESGIPAPLLTDSVPILETILEKDRLNVFVNKSSQYIYPNMYSMEL